MRQAMLAGLLLCWASCAWALSNEDLTMQPPCAALDSANPDNDPVLAERIAIVRYACRLPVDDVDATAAQTELGDQALTAVRSGDTLTVFARVREDGGERLALSGTLFGNLERIGNSPFAAARFHLEGLDRATIGLSLHGVGAPEPSWSWRGPAAPPRPQRKAEPDGQIVERRLYSEALGETRRLFIYLPRGYRRGGDYAALFMGDGGLVNSYARLIEPLIDLGAVPPLVLIGAESGQEGIVEDRAALGADIRSLDYLPDYRGQSARFPLHMRFFSEELVAFAVRDYSVTTDPRRRVVAGHSNGASLAFWAAYLHPDVFGNAIVCSQAWRPVDDIAPSTTRARFFMSAGLYEPAFLRTTRHTAAALRAQGYEVTFDEAAAGHNDQTDVMIVDRMQRIF